MSEKSIYQQQMEARGYTEEFMEHVYNYNGNMLEL